MSRTRLLPDSEIFAQVLTLLEAHGDKAVSFGALSRATGLAPSTLAQRYGSVDGMLRATISAEWARLGDAIDLAANDTSKGAQGLLKSLPSPNAATLACSLRDPQLRPLAADWRARIEALLSARRGGGAKGAEAAALIFAAWQGRQMWDGAGGKSFRLSEVIKRLG